MHLGGKKYALKVIFIFLLEFGISKAVHYKYTKHLCFVSGYK